MRIDARQALQLCSRVFIYIGIFSFCISVLMLTVPIYMMQMFDRVIQGRSEDTLIMLTIIAVGALVVQGLLEITRSHVLIHVSTWFDRTLGPPVAADIVRHGAARVDGVSPQSIRDVTILRTFLSGPAVLNFFDAPFVPVYLAIVYLIHPLMGHVALGGSIVLVFLGIANERLTKEPISIANRFNQRYMRSIEAGHRNAEVVDAMGMLGAMMTRWRSESEKILTLQHLASSRAAYFSALTKGFRLFVQLGIMAVGAWLTLEQQITAGAMIAGSIIMGRALAPVEMLIGSWRSVLDARQSYHSINKTLSLPSHRDSEMTYPEPAGLLTVEGVAYRPANSMKPLVYGISFHAYPEQCLGIIGPTGAGKSVLARLLIGAWPPMTGTVRLDGISIHDWSRADLGKHIGYLPQDIELFAGTVRENISRMAPGSDAEIIAAAQAANAHDMIVHLPQGYDTEIGDDGGLLSGGQRQRIGLARALYGSPKFLVLDEPNSNLDTEGENALIAAISAAKERGATVIVITHRTNMLSCVDRILVMQGGTIESVGPRDAMLQRLHLQPAAQVPDNTGGAQTRLVSNASKT